MVEKPDIEDVKIIACLQGAFGISTEKLVFLPLGADRNSAVYSANTAASERFFVKLRKDDFADIAATLPKFFHDQGIAQIIAPLASKTGQLWANLEPYKVILYPFIEGRNGYEVNLPDHHWYEFGAALKRVHTALVTPTLKNSIPKETYSPQWRENLKRFLEQVERETYHDPISVDLSAYLKEKHAEIQDLVERAERLANILRARSPKFVVCHSDVHAGNLHITPDGHLYIVDWDNPILAPKERDLMYPGGGLLGGWRTPEEEEDLFYKGYGPAQVDPTALAYYRYERIVQDIAVECEEILLSSAGDRDRAQSLYYLKSNFFSGGVLEIARKLGL